MPYVRTVKTGSGATAVVWSSRRGSRSIWHIGSAHDEAELEALKAAARQRMAAGQLEPGLGTGSGPSGPLPVTSSRTGVLLEALERACRALGPGRAAGGDLQARPIYHRKRDSIEAHLTIIFAALAVSRWIEAQTGWSIRKFVRTARRYRTIEIQAGQHTITAADPIPDDLRQALQAITRPS